MVIFEICDGICYSFILAHFAAHDDKDISWLHKTLLGFLGFLFPVDYGYCSMGHQRGENVGME